MSVLMNMYFKVTKYKYIGIMQTGNLDMLFSF